MTFPIRCHVLAAVLAGLCLILAVPVQGRRGAGVGPRIDARSVWRPGPRARKAIRDAAAEGRGTKRRLLAIMRAGGASRTSMEFAARFPGAPGYLAEIDPPHFPDGFTVGVVRYPFGPPAARAVVVLNGHPRLINLSDPRLVDHIHLESSPEFRKLWGHSVRARCVWSGPRRYAVQPGVRLAGSTDVEVTFPIEDAASHRVIGTARVLYEFSFPGRRLAGTWLDFLERTGK